MVSRTLTCFRREPSVTFFQGHPWDPFCPLNLSRILECSWGGNIHLLLDIGYKECSVLSPSSQTSLMKTCPAPSSFPMFLARLFIPELIAFDVNLTLMLPPFHLVTQCVLWALILFLLSSPLFKKRLPFCVCPHHVIPII